MCNNGNNVQSKKSSVLILIKKYFLAEKCSLLSQPPSSHNLPKVLFLSRQYPRRVEEANADSWAHMSQFMNTEDDELGRAGVHQGIL